MAKVHEMLNQPGIQTSYEALKRFWNIPNLRQKLKLQRENCNICQKFYKTTHKYGKIQGKIHTEMPFQDICSDIYEPIDTFHFEEGKETKYIFCLLQADVQERQKFI